MVQIADAAATSCSACGETLAANGACLVCLLRAGLDEHDDGCPPGSDDAVFGDFEIERREDGSFWELGRGAVGVTYRATDRVLHRAVALKVIDPPAAADARAMRERFLREARAAAALRHPNIATVFQFGASPESDRCYCALELVEGETLEARVRRGGPIGYELALELGRQVANALTAAAERGLVHRDLKPGNIMLAHSDDRRRVEVKVIDFGLAKAITSAEQMELTQGAFVGTPAFASPEQFEGGAVDVRSDIYALGVTLWFSLTGRLPSAGTTIEEIRQRQTGRQLPIEQLQARGVPRALIDLLRSCLELDPSDRPASARELLRAFEECRVGIGRTKRKRAIAVAAAVAVILVAATIALQLNVPQPSPPDVPAGRPIEKGIAVLPFENASTSQEDSFLADGLQDDVLNTLGKIKELKVIGRSSVAEHRRSAQRQGAGEIGRLLGVSHVLEGSVRRAGDRTVVHVALIDTRNDRQIWSERYERGMNETASLHADLAREIARALRAKLTPLEDAAVNSRLTDSAEAYLLYLKARNFEVNQAGPEKAAELYKRAVALDPGFALAKARYSLCLTAAFYEAGELGVQEEALREAQEALQLQPTLGEAYVALAHWHLYHRRDDKRALEELGRAVELLPNSAEVQLTAAFIHKRQNNFRERLAALRRARALDPRNHVVENFVILTSRWVRDWREAMHATDRRLVLGPAAAFMASRWSRAQDEFRLTGDLGVLQRALADDEADQANIPAARLNYARFEIATFERDFDRAAQFLAQIPADAFDAAGKPADLNMIAGHNRPFNEALLAVARGDDPLLIEPAFQRARDSLQAALGQIGPVHFRSSLYAQMALLDGFSGRKEDAIAHAQRAIELEDSQWSAIEQNDMRAALALVYARTGEPDKALDLIEHLLTQPAELQDGTVYNMTLTDLKWHWVWDPLRDHPRFQKLLAGPEPKTIY